MRSFDYCHFSVTLAASSTEGAEIIEKTGLLPEEVDDLRKVAARLADKAVDQYKVKKANESRLTEESRSRRWYLEDIERIKEKDEERRTPEEQAKLKLHQDERWEAHRSFDYEDDWRDDGTDD